MTHAPFRVLVYPYRRLAGGGLQYALFRRRGLRRWHGISGPSKGDEIPLEAARREAYEEANIPFDRKIVQLSTVVPVPISFLRKSRAYEKLSESDLYVIPQYCFGLSAPNSRIAPRRDDVEFRWVSYEAAQSMIQFQANRIAFWELHARLTERGARGLGVHGLQDMV